MKNLLIRFALWLLQVLGEAYFLAPDATALKTAKTVVREVEVKHSGQSGEFKRHEALRALLNCLPTKSEREIALLIELALD